jgi:5-methylcytosine-specific restriction endonuclease McrA
MRKKYINHTYAYCGREGVSTTRDHVVAKEFFLARDRGDLPVVPACKKCNRDKSILEHYTLTILPLASRHVDAKEYSVANIKEASAQKPHSSEQTICRVHWNLGMSSQWTLSTGGFCRV